METLKKIAFYLCVLVLIALVQYNLLSTKIDTYTITVTSNTKQIKSIYLSYQEQSTNEEQKGKVEELREVMEIIENKQEVIPNDEVISSSTTKENIILPVVEELMGTLSGYGPDCSGCTTNLTASGYYVGDGNIYYQDETYGKVRIVAGDEKYPFGTIVKMSQISFLQEEVIAIVLDRGSAIGIDKKATFDLLYPKEKDVPGLSKNTKFEILRLGY